MLEYVLNCIKFGLMPGSYCLYITGLSMRKAVLLIFAIIVALFSQPTAIAQERHRAADLLSPELAQKILGVSVKANSGNAGDTESGPNWTSRCNYYSDGPSIALLIRHFGTAAEAQNIFQSSKATFQGEEVPSLGCNAFRTRRPAQLNLLKGCNWLTISAGTFQEPNLVKQEELAKIILPKVNW